MLASLKIQLHRYLVLNHIIIQQMSKNKIAPDVSWMWDPENQVKSQLQDRRVHLHIFHSVTIFILPHICITVVTAMSIESLTGLFFCKVMCIIILLAKNKGNTTGTHSLKKMLHSTTSGQINQFHEMPAESANTKKFFTKLSLPLVIQSE